MILSRVSQMVESALDKRRGSIPRPGIVVPHGQASQESLRQCNEVLGLVESERNNP